MERRPSAPGTDNHDDYVLGLHTALQKYDLAPEEIDALRQWNFSRPVWLEEQKAKASIGRRRSSTPQMEPSPTEELISPTAKAALVKTCSGGLQALTPPREECANPPQFEKEMAKASPPSHPPESSLDTSAANRPFDGTSARKRDPEIMRPGAPSPVLVDAVSREPERTRAKELWAKVRRSVFSGTFMLRIAAAMAEQDRELSDGEEPESAPRKRVDALLIASSAESDTESKGQLSRLGQLRKGMNSMNVFSSRKGGGDNKNRFKNAEMQTNEDQEVLDIKPVYCLLHDCCAAIGASYAEIWTRKPLEGTATEHTDSLSAPDSTPHHTHGHRFGIEEVGDTDSPPPRSPVQVRSSSKKTLRAPSAPQEAPSSPKQLFSSLRHKASGNFGRGSSGGKLPFLKEDTHGSQGSFGLHRRPSLVGALGILGLVADDHTHEVPGAQLASSLTFADYSYVDQELLESQVVGRTAQLEGQNWRMVQKRLDTLTRNQQLHYTEGVGLPGAAWAHEHILDWHDLSVLDDSDELLQKDARCLVLRRFFDMSVGVKIMDPTSTYLVGVLILYKTFPSEKKRSNRLNYRQFSSQAVVTDLLKNAGKGAYWCMKLQEASATFVQLRAEEEAAERLSMDEGDDTIVERKSLDIKFRHWWWKFFKKFRGQKGTPPGKNTWQYSIWSFIGCFVVMLIISAVNRGMRDIQYNNDYLFILINSMGALSAMVFAAPASPIVQPRNIFGGHIISAVSGLLVDYLSNPEYLGVLPEWVAVPLAPAVAVLLMCKFGLFNPPACACSVIYLAGRTQIKNLGWMYIACPILLDCSIVVITGVAVNNLSKERTYPLFW